MTLGIMQPYFFPYLGYYQLMNAVDIFVVYDNIEFSKGGWFHRNRFLMNGEVKKFAVPVKKDKNTLHVRDRFLAENAGKSLRKSLAQIQNTYKNAPYFEEVYPLLKNVFLHKENNLFKFLFYSLEIIRDYLEINTDFIISSDIAVEHEQLSGQQKVISICKALNADSYINPIGGLELYEEKVFQKEFINLKFLKIKVLLEFE